MKPARSRLRRLVPVCALFAGCILDHRIAAALVPQAPQAVSALSSFDDQTGRRKPSPLDLSSVQDSRRRAQIQRVVEAIDRTGAPPAGVVQGGRRGGQKGLFQNAEGRLPRQPRGYWIESDVWPKKGPRDAERLIFGRKGEVYWTRDHYETFVRLR